MPICNPCSDDPVGAHLAQFANPLQPYSVNSPNVPRLTGAVAKRLPDMRDELLSVLSVTILPDRNTSISSPRVSARSRCVRST